MSRIAATFWSLTLLLAAAVGFVRAKPQTVERPPRITWDDVWGETGYALGEGVGRWYWDLERVDPTRKREGWRALRSKTATDLERVTCGDTFEHEGREFSWLAGKRGDRAVLVVLACAEKSRGHTKRLGEFLLPPGCIIVGVTGPSTHGPAFAADAGNACIWRLEGLDENAVPARAVPFAVMPATEPWFDGRVQFVGSYRGDVQLTDVHGCRVMGDERVLLLDDTDDDGRADVITPTTLGLENCSYLPGDGPLPRLEPRAGDSAIRFVRYEDTAPDWPEVWSVDATGTLRSAHPGRARLDTSEGRYDPPRGTSHVPLRRTLREGEWIRLRDPNTGYWGSPVAVIPANATVSPEYVGFDFDKRAVEINRRYLAGPGLRITLQTARGIHVLAHRPDEHDYSLEADLPAGYQPRSEDRLRVEAHGFAPLVVPVHNDRYP